MGRNKWVTVNRQKLKIDGNNLRALSQVEIENNGYPTSPQDAASKGFNRYQDEKGVVQEMRFKSRAKTGKFVEGLSMEIEPAERHKRDRGSYRASIKKQAVRKKDYIEVFGKEVGEPLWKEERDKKHSIKKSKSDLQHTDHFKPLSKGGIDASRNYRNIDAFKNMSEGNKRKLTQFQLRSLGLEGTTPHDYVGTNGPWATTEINEKIISGEITENSTKLPKTEKAEKLYKELRYGARIIGQSPYVYSNFGGDLVGTVVDGASFIADPNLENYIDLALSSGQTLTSLAGAGLKFVGMENLGLAVVLVGDRLAVIEKLMNMAREGWTNKTRKITGGAIDPWKIK